MEKIIGKVTEVFIPEEYNDGKLLEIMERTQIGFKVMTDNGLEEIIEPQNEFNSDILKGDLVMITKQNISGKDFIDIELYSGDEDD